MDGGRPGRRAGRLHGDGDLEGVGMGLFVFVTSWRYVFMLLWYVDVPAVLRRLEGDDGHSRTAHRSWCAWDSDGDGGVDDD